MTLNPTKYVNELVWGRTLENQGLPGKILATVLRYIYAVLRDVVSGQLNLRAMSLVYTTLLSIVPLLAFSFSVLKGFDIHKQLESRLYLFLEPLGDKGVEITDNIVELVDNVNGGALGTVSLAIFLYTAISMVQKVEESFNYVWYVTKPRSFARRFTEYVLVLLIGPLVIVIALGMLTSLQNESFVQYLLTNEYVGPVFVATSRLMPYLLISGVFAFLYWFMPNTEVRIGSALIGGLAGGILWASVGLIFTNFILGAGRTQAVYAGFAIAIFALFWLYLNWLVLLIGAQLAFYFQNPAYLRIGRREPRLSTSMRERLALNIMLLIGAAHRHPERSVTLRSLSDQLRIPSLTLAPILTGLEKDGLVTSNDQDHLLPGREISRIALRDILGVVRSRGETGSLHEPRWSPIIDELGGQLDDAEFTTVGERTLADLLDESENGSAPRDGHPVDEQ